jgi:hypothetical protein
MAKSPLHKFMSKDIVAWSPAHSNVLPVPLQSFPILPSLFDPTDLREHSTTPKNGVEGLYKMFIDLYWLCVAGVHL